MPSRQLLRLTEHGRGLLSSRRKCLLLAIGIVVTGGTAAAYMHSRNSCTRQNAFGHSNGAKDYKEQSNELIVKENNVKKGRQKRGSLRPLQVLAAILLSRMGTGAINILSLVAIAVHGGQNKVENMQMVEAGALGRKKSSAPARLVDF